MKCKLVYVEVKTNNSTEQCHESHCLPYKTDIIFITDVLCFMDMENVRVLFSAE